MIISEDRQSHLAHLVIDGLWKADLVDYTSDEQALRAGKKAVQAFVQEFEEIDQKARDTITSLKRDVFEGSPEWDVLYGKYCKEEAARRGY